MTRLQNLLKEADAEKENLEERQRLLEQWKDAGKALEKAREEYEKSCKAAEKAQKRANNLRRQYNDNIAGVLAEKAGGRTALSGLRQRASSASRNHDRSHQPACCRAGGKEAESAKDKASKDATNCAGKRRRLTRDTSSLPGSFRMCRTNVGKKPFRRRFWKMQSSRKNKRVN